MEESGKTNGRVSIIWSLVLFGTLSIVDGAADDYRLGAVDRIKVAVFGHEDLSGEFEISATGRLAFPLIQEVQAGGVATGELEDVITDKPAHLKNPSVSVQVVNYRPFFILGEVKSSGSYSYVTGMTVVTTVGLAGGDPYRAKTARANVTRTADPENKKRVVDPNTQV
jgi:protein involved in polysaccharide export with SLBB domain